LSFNTGDIAVIDANTYQTKMQFKVVDRECVVRQMREVADTKWILAMGESKAMVIEGSRIVK
jgi:hypothetical protein